MRILSLNRVLLLATCLLLIPGIFADTIYKSVDINGKISYSSSPAEGQQKTVKVNILPPPSEAAVKAAKEHHQQNLRANKTLIENRQKRSQKIAEENRIKRAKNKKIESYQQADTQKESGPYYGIPGHGILVLPAGPRIQH